MLLTLCNPAAFSFSTTATLAIICPLTGGFAAFYILTPWISGYEKVLNDKFKAISIVENIFDDIDQDQSGQVDFTGESLFALDIYIFFLCGGGEVWLPRI